MKRFSLLLALFVSASMIMVSCGDAPAPAVEEEAVVEEVVAEEVVVEEAVVVEDVATVNLENGKVIYDQMCQVCHVAAVGGAAKLDDVARWETSAAKGLETMYSNSINGFTGDFGVMPAKGGNANFSDQDVKDAVDYMLNEAGVTAN